MKFLKKYNSALVFFLIFEAIAFGLWFVLDNIFYLFNFSYIGCCLAVGMVLYINKYKYARLVVQFAVGLYMLVGLGIIGGENMQIEGFWFYLFCGVFQAAVIHYSVAKIFGPLIFGRGWCGYACWTAMILDLLPYKTAAAPRRNWGYIRYVVFMGSLLFVGGLFVFNVADMEKIMFVAFVFGNAVYYAVGIFLAFYLKDNRAFCKYICPVTVFLKPASYYSVLRVKVDKNKCINCGICLKQCPMEVDMLNNERRRINGTECILCLQCVSKCPKGALKM